MLLQHLRVLVYVFVFGLFLDCCVGLTHGANQHSRVRRQAGSKNATSASASAGRCAIPPAGPTRTFSVYDTDNNPVNFPTGAKIPKLYKLTVQCKNGYQMDTTNLISEFYCSHNGNWSSPIQNCLKPCKTLQAHNMDIACVPDECPSQYFAGARVRPRCKPLYHEKQPAYYRYLTCLDTGEWDKELFECVPDCGKQSSLTLISGGIPAIYGDSPWHVAIYDIKKSPPLLICGGTIISSSMVISAAHCFYDEIHMAQIDEKNYEVVVSKITRDYNTIDTSTQEAHKIKKIIFPPEERPYHPSTSNHASDIVVLILQKQIILSQHVLPVCVSWSDPAPFNPGENTTGQFVGWGITDQLSFSPSKTLLSAKFPYISYGACIKKTRQVDLDKFCAGSDSGPGAQVGDAGGGIVFRNLSSGLYFLRGVLSTKDRRSNNSVAAFTDLTYHAKWIHEAYNENEKGILKSETTLGSKI